MAVGAFEGKITGLYLPKKQWSAAVPGVTAEYAPGESADSLDSLGQFGLSR
jgi:hypothetical protein